MPEGKEFPVRAKTRGSQGAPLAFIGILRKIGGMFTDPVTSGAAMIRRKENRRVEQVPNMRGGKGTIIVEHLLEPEDFAQTGRLLAVNTIRPGCSIGEHLHQGEFEAYIITSGQGRFSDNGQITTVGPGDICLTRSGESHSIENAGTEDLVFTALINYVKNA